MPQRSRIWKNRANNNECCHLIWTNTSESIKNKYNCVTTNGTRRTHIKNEYHTWHRNETILNIWDYTLAYENSSGAWAFLRELIETIRCLKISAGTHRNTLWFQHLYGKSLNMLGVWTLVCEIVESNVCWMSFEHLTTFVVGIIETAAFYIYVWNRWSTLCFNMCAWNHWNTLGNKTNVCGIIGKPSVLNICTWSHWKLGLFNMCVKSLNEFVCLTFVLDFMTNFRFVCLSVRNHWNKLWV